jgi:hypothetical protein
MSPELHLFLSSILSIVLSSILSIVLSSMLSSIPSSIFHKLTIVLLLYVYIYFTSQMGGTNYDHVKANDAGAVVAKTVKYLMNNGKLIPFQNAQSIANRDKNNPENDPTKVEYSAPWWNHLIQVFAELGVKLPSIPALHDYSIGEDVPGSSFGLYKKNKAGELKPVLFDEDAIPVVHGNKKYAAFKDNIKVLASKLNEDFCAPTEAKLRLIMSDFETEIQRIVAEHYGNDAPQAISFMRTAPDTAMYEIGPGEAITKTQMAELYAQHMEQNNRILGCIEDSASRKNHALKTLDSLAANQKAAIASNERMQQESLASNERMLLKVVDSNNHIAAQGDKAIASVGYILDLDNTDRQFLYGQLEDSRIMASGVFGAVAAGDVAQPPIPTASKKKAALTKATPSKKSATPSKKSATPSKKKATPAKKKATPSKNKATTPAKEKATPAPASATPSKRKATPKLPPSSGAKPARKKLVPDGVENTPPISPAKAMGPSTPTSSVGSTPSVRRSARKAKMRLENIAE